MSQFTFFAWKCLFAPELFVEKTANLFSKLSLPFCQRLVVSICVVLYLNSLFCSVDLLYILIAKTFVVIYICLYYFIYICSIELPFP